MRKYRQGGKPILQTRRLWYLFLAIILTFITVHCHPCLALDIEPVIIDGLYYYTIFNSSNNDNVVDGASNVGMMCYPSFAAAAYGNQSVVFCDMCHTGSSIRIINASGIFTLSGSVTMRDFKDGARDVALFQGSNDDELPTNGVSGAGNFIYIADSYNNAVRVISPEGKVKTLFYHESKYDGKGISKPSYIATYTESSGTSNIIISDYGNNRVLWATLSPSTSVLALLTDDLQANKLIVTKDKKLLYYIAENNVNKLGAVDMGSHNRWVIGKLDCLGFKRSLALTSDEKELLYYGSVNNVDGVYSISADTTPELAPLLCPKLKFRWTGEFAEFNDVITRDDTSWWVLAKTALYLVSTKSVNPDSSSSSSDYSHRHHAVVAFPSDALPTNDSCLMSQFFYWVRMDVTVAYKTNDYLTQFESFADLNKLVPGSFNVSTWCDKISASKSKDGTITFLNFLGPPALSPSRTQSALTNSDWKYTRAFLDGQGGEKIPFCFVSCGEQCGTSTFSKKLCVGYKSIPCDGVCKGVIASSVVMGGSAVALFTLMILSPSNILTALMMIPII